MYQSVLQFWYHEIEPAQWWKVDPSFDALIAERFGRIHHKAASGELFEWRSTPQGRLAEVIVLDQFSRNIFRNDRRAFEHDAQALALAQEAVAAGAANQLPQEDRTFLYMPYMHSESQLIHVIAEELFRKYAPRSNYEFELRHKEIVDRFGRYPHRNTLLGRQSTPEELQFLTEPGSRF